MNTLNLKEFCEKNWYYLKTSIDWDWNARYGDWIPSVTTILKLIWDKWFEFVLDRYKDEVEIAANKWTLVHNNAESYFKGDLRNDIDFNDKDKAHLKLNPFISKFHSLFVKEIKNQETRYVKHWVSGTIDLEAIINYRWKIEDLNSDYKNAKMKSEKYKVQLGWYKTLNGKNWLIVYVWNNKLELVYVDPIYEKIFIELREYFFKLLKEKNDNDII